MHFDIFQENMDAYIGYVDSSNKGVTFDGYVDICNYRRNAMVFIQYLFSSIFADKGYRT